MGHHFFFVFFPCKLLPPHPPYLIILSASPSLFFKQSSHIEIGTKIANKHSPRTAIELGLPVLKSSTKISKLHVPTNSEHKFHKVRIENWPPIEFKLRFPWLIIRWLDYQLRSPWVGVPLLGTRNSTTKTVQVFPSLIPDIGLQ